MRRILLAVAALLGAAVAASAATVPYRTDAELVAISDRVVRGRVLDSVVERAPSGAIRTRTRVAVIEDFTGGADDDPHRPRARRPPARRHRRVDPRRAAVRAGRRRGPVPRADRRRLPHRVDGVLGVPRRRRGGRRSTADAIRRHRRRRRSRRGAAWRRRAGSTEFRRAAGTVTGVAARAVLTEAQATAAVAAAARDRVDGAVHPARRRAALAAGRQRSGDHLVPQHAQALAGPGRRHRRSDCARPSLRGPIRRQRPSR